MLKVGIPLVLIVVLGLCRAASGAAQRPVRVLIVDGFSNHDWQHTTRCLQAMLAKSAEFKVAVSTFPAAADEQELSLWNPHFSDYDVVIQTCNDIGGGPKWPRPVELALERYVENGGGLFIFHSANNAFPHWKAYNRIIGLGWRDKDFGFAIRIDSGGEVIRIPAGEGEGTSHGKRVNALLTRVGDHPIHAGLPRQWTAADIEIYRYARGPAEDLTVLSYARDEKTGINFPIEWTVTYGKGRIYNSTLGHVWKDQDEPAGICCAGFQTLLPRVIEWLAGREVDASVPPDFPASASPSLRAYPEMK